MKTKTPELMKNPDGSVVVEAISADAALEAVRAELGADVNVIAATRESRGGLGGFFAKEVFVVHAAQPTIAVLDQSTPPPATPEGDVTSDLVEQQPAGLSELLRRVESGDDGAKGTFGDLLRQEIADSGREPREAMADVIASESGVIDLTDGSGPSLAEREAAAVEARRRRAARRQRQARIRAEQQAIEQAPAQPQPNLAAPAVPAPSSMNEAPVADPGALRAKSTPGAWAPPVKTLRARSASQLPRLGQPAGSAAGSGAVDWSLDRLASIGMPFSFVQDLVGIDAEDDLAWIHAIASQFERHCRPLPVRESVFVGPRAGKLAPLLGVPSVTFPDDPPYGGSVCLRMDDDGAHRAWLARVQGDRALQLVIGGTAWSDLLSKDPVAVSYVGGPELLISALQLCMKREIALGYAMTPAGAFRLNPLDAALQIRFLVGRR
jgi:hypothetical protein